MNCLVDVNYIHNLNWNFDKTGENAKIIIDKGANSIEIPWLGRDDIIDWSLVKNKYDFILENIDLCNVKAKEFECGDWDCDFITRYVTAFSIFSPGKIVRQNYKF